MRSMVTALSLLLVFACVAPRARAEEPARDGVFVHISHGTDDPHRLLMALQMAGVMADEHDVLVYFDIKAVDAVLKGSEDVSFAQFQSSKTQIQALLKKNVTLMVCPGCLKAAGKSAADVAEGIQIADKKVFFSFTKGRILTLDY